MTTLLNDVQVRTITEATSSQSMNDATHNLHDHEYAALEKMHRICNITMLDYDHKDSEVQYNLDNDTLEAALLKPRPSNSKVRWINVNGFSWDVVTCLGRHFGIHPLVLEDIM